MAKLAEKIAPALNQKEVDALISDHYRGESQTLTTGARSNLLKLAEMRGILTPEEQNEWARIKDEFLAIKRMGGNDDDPMARMTGSLSLISDQLKAIPFDDTTERVSTHLEEIQSALSGLSISTDLATKPRQWDSAKVLASGLPIQVQSIPDLKLPSSTQPNQHSQDSTPTEISEHHIEQSLVAKVLGISDSARSTSQKHLLLRSLSHQRPPQNNAEPEMHALW